MVERIDALTRLNRQRGLTQMMANHTIYDLRLPTSEATATAWILVERSAMVFPSRPGLGRDGESAGGVRHVHRGDLNDRGLVHRGWL